MPGQNGTGLGDNFSEASISGLLSTPKIGTIRGIDLKSTYRDYLFDVTRSTENITNMQQASRLTSLRRSSIDRDGDAFLQSFDRDQKSTNPSTIPNSGAFGPPGQAKGFQLRPQQGQQPFADGFGVPNNRSESPLGIGNGTGDGIKPPGLGNRRTPLEEMRARDRYGLPGFMGQLRSNNPDTRALAIGQDLTSLGLNLNSAE